MKKLKVKKIFKELFDGIDFNPFVGDGAICKKTNTKYWEVSSGWAVSDAPFDCFITAKSRILAIDLYYKSVLSLFKRFANISYTGNKPAKFIRKDHIIHWRQLPTIETNGSGEWIVYSRFLIQRKEPNQ